jgi:hypothetical protein
MGNLSQPQWFLCDIFCYLWGLTLHRIALAAQKARVEARKSGNDTSFLTQVSRLAKHNDNTTGYSSCDDVME